MKRSEYFASAWKELLFGQDHVINQIVPYINRAEAGLSLPNKPLGVFFLMGSTGSGKSYAAESLAEVLHNSSSKVLRIDCAEFQLEHDISKLTGCFTPETPILLANGSRKQIKDICVGDQVITKNGRVRPVTFLHKYEHEGDMLEINFSSHNKPLVATRGHKILAIKVGQSEGRIRNPKNLYDKDKLEWVHADHLQKNDIVVYPRFKSENITVPDKLDLMNFQDDPNLKSDCEYLWYREDRRVKRYIEINENLCRLLGYYVGDGSLGKNKIDYTVGVPQKNDIVVDLIRIIPEIFGNEVTFSIEPHGENAKRIVIHSKIIANLIENLCSRTAQFKQVPEFLFHISEELQWNFIDAAIMCDGSVVVDRRVDYSTVSETLFSQLQLLLRQLGFTTSVQQLSSERYGKKCLDRYRIYISGDQIDNFASKLPISGKKLKLDDNGFGGRQRQSFVDDEYVYFRVKSIDTVPYKGFVHDFSVEEDTSYVAGNLCVSNSNPGYLGHKETQPLLSKAKLNSVTTDKCPISIILFDEIEKANASLWKLLLGVLDKATINLGDNTSTNFENSLIFMSSNLSAKEISELLTGSFGFGSNLNEKIEVNKGMLVQIEKLGNNAMKKKFPPEFPNRIDEIMAFHPLTNDILYQITKSEIEKIEQFVISKLGVRSFILKYDDSVINFLTKKGTSLVYGARELKRAINRHLLNPIVNEFLDGEILPNNLVNCYVENDQLKWFTEDAPMCLPEIFQTILDEKKEKKVSKKASK